MSKKKSTMTLKDFHGGSIPSDLPLPSAPGAAARPSDRSAFDRPIASPAWGSPISGGGVSSRSDNLHRPRPGSSGAGSRVGGGGIFEERPSLLSHPVQIGRNFDEDERKPFDASSAPRRHITDPDDVLRGPPTLPARPESAPKLSSSSVARSTPFSTATAQSPSIGPAKLPGASAGTAAPNVWAARKEAAIGNIDLTVPAASPAGWSGPGAVSRFAQASAVEKCLQGCGRLPGSLCINCLPDPGHIEAVVELHGSTNPPKPGSSGGVDGERRGVERPKLNLKPRSQPVEQPDGSLERERKTLFGGARPRELVLKDRGIDSVALENLDLGPPTNRVKHEVPRTDVKQEAVAPTNRHAEAPMEPKTGRDPERRDHRSDAPRNSSWRNDNRRHNEKPQEQRQQEPENWRKPVDPPKSPPSEAEGPRFKKASSALELAQAFSRSVSEAKADGHPTSHKGQVPFSRLTDSREFRSGPNQRQINGY
ncbi:hypothetical protein QJS10_CPA01g01052 [Acorus calamus]|uniref:Uncharacterized protein n=1 Tax=Acorus calamus TaxID=4465 RepID=A0AAV9FM43_ACOCL|nr:hypothetical protein QJS10_CPA01g01052 [Acorus calamus]